MPSLLWTEALERTEPWLRGLSQGDVVAIGIRPTTVQDDPILTEVLDTICSLRGHKEYVSPSATDCGAFERRGFVAHKEKFEEWLQRTPVP